MNCGEVIICHVFTAKREQERKWHVRENQRSHFRVHQNLFRLAFFQEKKTYHFHNM